ncbi:MAG: cache and HAMP domain-containing protein [Desulfocapsaceae bacterium]|nr:cache and HAMP domain-containing protein [Desulfocapsaceae bacterium]
MVVICEECGLKYQIDPSKIKGDKARFKCKGCSTSIVVDKNDYQLDDDVTSLEEALLSQQAERSDDQEAMPDDLDALVNTGTGATGSTENIEEIPSSATTESVPVEAAKKRSGLGLTAKVIFLMLLVSLLPGVIYFALSFNQISQQIVSETNKTGKTVTRLLASEVDEWIDKNVRVLNAIANSPAIRSMSQADQEIMLKAIQSEYPWMYLVFTTDERGLNIARSDGKKLTDYSDRQYVKEVIGGADIAWQNLIGRTSKKPALVLAVPIKRGDIIVGVLAAAMTRDTISELVTTYGEGRTGSSFLVDETGKAVAHRQNAYVIQQRDMSDHPLVQAADQNEAKRVEFIDANGKPTIGFAKNTKLGWTLAIQQEREEAFDALKQAQTFAYYMFAGTFVVIILIAFFSSRAIVTPIRNLTDAANRISVGDLDVEISTKSKDEIGDLADAIVRMQDSIRLSISRLTRRRR